MSVSSTSTPVTQGSTPAFLIPVTGSTVSPLLDQDGFLDLQVMTDRTSRIMYVLCTQE
jgi:hypothetical protein